MTTPATDDIRQSLADLRDERVAKIIYSLDDILASNKLKGQIDPAHAEIWKSLLHQADSATTWLSAIVAEMKREAAP